MATKHNRQEQGNDNPQVQVPQKPKNIKSKMIKDQGKSGHKDQVFKKRKLKNGDAKKIEGENDVKIKELKRAYNKLIQKKKPLSKEQKASLIQKHLNVVKEELLQMAFKHDQCRIVQQFLKHGNQEQQSLIINALSKSIIQLAKQNYSYHLIKKMYEVGNQELKQLLFNEILQFASKLIVMKNGMQSLNYVFKHSSQLRKIQLINQICFQKLQNNEKYTSLQQCFEQNPQQKEIILHIVSKVVQKSLDKGGGCLEIIQNLIICLYENYNAKTQEIVDISYSVIEDFAKFQTTKEGNIIISFSLIFQGQPKLLDLVSQKNVKTEMSQLMQSNSYIFLIRLFQLVDDFKFIKKNLLKWIKSSDLQELLKNNFASKLLLYLLQMHLSVNDTNFKFFGKEEKKIIDFNNCQENCKSQQKVSQIQEYIINKTFNKVTEHFQSLMKDKAPFFIELYILSLFKTKQSNDEKIQKIRNLLVQQEMLEHPSSHRIIKFLVKNEDGIAQEIAKYYETRSQEQIIGAFLTREIWILVEVVQKGFCKEIVQKALKEVTSKGKYKIILEEKKTGFEILKKNLDI